MSTANRSVDVRASDQALLAVLQRIVGLTRTSRPICRVAKSLSALARRAYSFALFLMLTQPSDTYRTRLQRSRSCQASAPACASRVVIVSVNLAQRNSADPIHTFSCLARYRSTPTSSSSMRRRRPAVSLRPTRRPRVSCSMSAGKEHTASRLLRLKLTSSPCVQSCHLLALPVRFHLDPELAGGFPRRFPPRAEYVAIAPAREANARPRARTGTLTTASTRLSRSRTTGTSTSACRMFVPSVAGSRTPTRTTSRCFPWLSKSSASRA